MHKQTILDTIELHRDGRIGLRFAQQVIDDDGTVLSSAWLRRDCAPGTDLSAEIADLNAALVAARGASIEPGDVERLSQIEPVVRRDELSTRHRAKVDAVQAEIGARA